MNMMVNYVLVIISWSLNISESRSVFTGSAIDINIELDIGPDTTSLLLSSHKPNVWFGISFDATSMSDGSYGVIYNANNNNIIKDAFIFQHSTPTLQSSSTWTLVNILTVNDETIITLTRPNTISNPDFVNFNDLNLQNEIDAIWAHGDSTTNFQYHGGSNRISSRLYRVSSTTTLSPTSNPSKSPSSNPSKSPTKWPTPWPTPSPICPNYGNGDKQCGYFLSECCRNDPLCRWIDDDYCNHEGGTECCILQTDSPTTNPSKSPTNNPSNSPTLNPTKSPSNNPSKSPTNSPSPSPTTMQPTYNPSMSPTQSPICFDDPSSENICYGLSKKCCPVGNGLCQWSDTDLCQFEGGPNCCILITNNPSNSPSNNPSMSPSKSPTNNPSNSPTFNPTVSPTNCRDYQYNVDIMDDACNGYTKHCCSMYDEQCIWKDDDLCNYEGGDNCCYSITSSPTSDPTPYPLAVDPVVFDAGCECEGGITSLDILYIGYRGAKSIDIMLDDGYNPRKICKFKDISYGDHMQCDIYKSKYNQFTDITRFTVKYDDNHNSGDSHDSYQYDTHNTEQDEIIYPEEYDIENNDIDTSSSEDRQNGDLSNNSGSGSGSGSGSNSDSSDNKDNNKCYGIFDTSCSRDIVGDICNECNELMIIGWNDMYNNLCNLETTNNIIESGYGEPMKHDINDEDINNETQKILNGNITQKASIIIAAIISIIVIIFVILCLKKIDKMYWKQDRKQSINSNEINMNGINPKLINTVCNGNNIGESNFVVEMISTPTTHQE